jgi:hypothetical protein
MAVPDADGNCSPELGLKSRPSYAASHIDTAVDPTGGSTGNLDNFVTGNEPSTGNCCRFSASRPYTRSKSQPRPFADTNNDFTLGYTNRPAGGIARVGVWDVNGVSPPLYLQTVVDFPPPLADEISTLIRKGTNPKVSNPGFNDSSLAGTSLVPIVAGVDGRLKHLKGETKVVEGVTMLLLWFEGAGYNERATAKLVLKVRASSLHTSSLPYFTPH